MNKSTYIVLGVVVVGLLMYGYGRRSQSGPATPSPSGAAPAIVAIDGSSTVYPIMEAVAEDFQKSQPNVKVTVGISGTGGGFKKFCNGETDISDASRPIKAEEIAACGEKNIQFIELPIAFDGIAVMVNRNNTWVSSLTVADLQKMWAPEAQGKVMYWSDVRPDWPRRELHLFGPGADSGTFDYFTEVVMGKSGSSRGDFTASEDDNVLVQGISTDEGALGYFGIAYYEQNKDKLKLVPIDGGSGPVLPDYEAIATGRYQPLSRPLFVYVAHASAQGGAVDGFIQYAIAHAPTLVKDVGYIALPDDLYPLVLDKYLKRTAGSVFSGADISMPVSDILRAEPR